MHSQRGNQRFGAITVGGVTLHGMNQALAVKVSPGTLAPGQAAAVKVAVPGAQKGDLVIAEPPLSLEPYLVFQGARVTGDDEVTLVFCYVGPEPVKCAARSWNLYAVDFTA